MRQVSLGKLGGLSEPLNQARPLIATEKEKVECLV